MSEIVEAKIIIVCPKLDKEVTFSMSDLFFELDTTGWGATVDYIEVGCECGDYHKLYR